MDTSRARTFPPARSTAPFARPRPRILWTVGDTALAASAGSTAAPATGPLAWPGPWQAVALRGAAAIAFAALALLWPGMTLFALALMWGIYALADGLCSLGHAWRLRRHGQGRWATAFVGLLGVGVGVAVFVWPPVAMLSLLGLVALWAVLAGAMQLLTALRLRRAPGQGRWLMGLSGLLTAALGVFVVVWPRPGVLLVMWMMAAHAMTLGVLMLALASRLARQPPRPAPSIAPRPLRHAPAQSASDAAKEAAAIVT